MFKGLEDLMKKGYSYKELIDIVKDEIKLANQIYFIKDPEVQIEYLSKAREYYGKKYKCDKNLVFLGDINFRKDFWKGGVGFHYAIVIGSLSAKDCYITAPNLKVVLGDLDLSRATANISSLEYARKLVVTGANIKNFNKDMKVDELICNENCLCKDFNDCFKNQIIDKESLNK